MDEQDGAFFVEPEEQEVREIKQIEQANPIVSKPIIDEPRSINLKMIQIPKPQHTSSYVPFKINAASQSSESEQGEEGFRFMSPFTEFYSKQQLVYQRYDNQKFNRINSISYFSGAFVPRHIIQQLTKQTSQSIQQILHQQFNLKQQDLPQYNIDPEDKSELLFDSNFQSGNLFAVFKISDKQYDLVMQNDTNACGNNQWFYFSIRNMIVGVQYTFNVVNFTKNDALFNYGMTPVAYSQLNNKKGDIGWVPIGRQISYKRGLIPKQNSRRYYYKLTFKFNWKVPNDKVYIAHSYPYTYKKLQQTIETFTIRNRDICSKIHIGKTLSKKNIDALVITSKSNKKKDNRKAIIVMARQHPGQTQGSFVCDGVIKTLLKKLKQSDFLRKNYIIYVIPMINPDGVIFGHYRTNLAGKDLNRKWDSTQKQVNCPQVTCIKSFLSEIHKQRQIRFILDLHGHSKKLNSFFYGNPYPQCPQHVRIFPFICSKLNPAVQFYDCTFASEEYKRKAARVYLSYMFKQVQVYTYQSSFYGYFKDGKKYQFTPKQFQNLGDTLVIALATVLQQQDAKNIDKTSQYNKFLTELKNNKNLLQIGTKQESGSESKPQFGQLNDEQMPKLEISEKRPPTPATTTRKPDKKTPNKKGPRQNKQIIKEINKPVRNLRFLEISRVNSVLPDRYQLGLQPIKKRQPQNILSRTHSTVLKINTHCQTDSKQIFDEYKQKQIQGCPNLANSVKVQGRSKRYSSVIKNTAKHNNIIFRIDFNNDRATSTTIGLKDSKTMYNAFSQTIVSFKRARNERIRSSQLFPSVQSPETDRKHSRTHHIKYQQNRTNKKEAQLFLNGMVKKYLMDKDIKMRDHQSKVIQRPLSIKKKQIYKKL